MVVWLTGVVMEPEVGKGPESSLISISGLNVIDVALVVAQVSVTDCPALTEAGFAVSEVTCGGAMGATVT